MRKLVGSIVLSVVGAVVVLSMGSTVYSAMAEMSKRAEERDSKSARMLATKLGIQPAVMFNSCKDGLPRIVVKAAEITIAQADAEELEQATAQVRQQQQHMQRMQSVPFIRDIMLTTFRNEGMNLTDLSGCAMAKLMADKYLGFLQLMRALEPMN
jgi:flagellar basal body-associated protein FliL